MNKPVIGLLVLSLVGCAATPMPIPQGYSGPLASVHDSHVSQGATKAYFFQLAKIDGRDVETSSMTTYQANYGRGFFMSPQVDGRQVPARLSVLHIEGVTYYAAPILALGGGNYSVEGDVTVDLKSDQAYSVKGTLSDSYCAVWVEDSAGNKVSNTVDNKGK